MTSLQKSNSADYGKVHSWRAVFSAAAELVVLSKRVWQRWAHYGNSHGNGNCGAKLMGIEMGMGIKLSEMGRNGSFLFREIPAPSHSYQIYNNLLIAFTITVAMASYYFISFWYHLYGYIKYKRTCYAHLQLNHFRARWCDSKSSVRPCVRPSVRDDQVSWSHRLEFFENNFTAE